MATAYYAPGVYIEEPDRGTKPIEGVSTSVAAFIGFTQKAEDADRERDGEGNLLKSILGEAKTITNWSQYQRHFGDYVAGSYTPNAVRGFFDNGGMRCYVISVKTLGGAFCAQTIVPALNSRSQEFSRLVVRTKKAHAGEVGNAWAVMFRTAGSGGTLPAPTPTPLPAPTPAPSGSTPQEGAPSTPEDASEAEKANKSGKPALAKPPTQTQTTTLNLSAGGSGGSGSSGNPSGGSGGGNNSQIEMIVRKRDANNNFVDEPPVLIDLQRLPMWGNRERQTEMRVAEAQASPWVEVWSLVGSNDPLVAFSPVTNTDFNLGNGFGVIDTNFLPPNSAAGTTNIVPRHIEGDSSKGLGALEAIDDVNLICVPDLMMLLKENIFSEIQVIELQKKIIAHCERMQYRFAILDCPPNKSVDGIKAWRMNAGFDPQHGHGAVYYPWLKIDDPLNPGKPLKIPPSGHMAGIYARSDAQRGVHKAPANETISGVPDLEYYVNRGEQEMLNPIGINCIRKFPGRGIRVWGARTLAMTDPSWRYVNVRRLFNYIEASIENSTQWVVFEPNDHILWGKIRRDVTAFMRTIWLSGALFGTTAEEAFYVKCDAELNPQETRDLGYLFIEVGLAPVKPAEFVVFRVFQWAAPTQ